MRKSKKEMKELIKETFKILDIETNLDKAVQACVTHHEAELIIPTHSLKKENKEVVTKFNSLQTKFSHVSENCFSTW